MSEIEFLEVSSTTRRPSATQDHSSAMFLPRSQSPSLGESWERAKRRRPSPGQLSSGWRRSQASRILAERTFGSMAATFAPPPGAWAAAGTLAEPVAPEST